MRQLAQLYFDLIGVCTTNLRLVACIVTFDDCGIHRAELFAEICVLASTARISCQGQGFTNIL